MAATSISIEQDQFSCPVCLEVLKDPATIPCGHSYCLDCIEGYWDKTKHKGPFSCPQCRQSFSPRPPLSRNTVLAEVVDQFERKARRATPPQQGSASEVRVKCDVCSGKKNAAVKSCLVCLESYCEPHLSAHEERFHGKSHKLIQGLGSLKEKLCPHHDKLLRVFCRTDQQCVCTVCVKERHKDHDTLSVAEERRTQQRQLEGASVKAIQEVKEIEKELRQVVRYIKHTADAAVGESERIFGRLQRCVERQQSEAREAIRSQERGAVGQAERLLERLERELAELRRRDAELEQLSHTDDHIAFLQRCKSLHLPLKTVDLQCIDVHPCFMQKIVKGSLADLKDRLKDVCEKELAKISDKVKEEHSSQRETCPQTTCPQTGKDTSAPHTSEPKNRSDLLQYCSDMVLDLNTANPYLYLSGGRRGVTTGSEPQAFPDHRDRFSSWAQVLCQGGLSGRRYWEVEWEGARGVSIGVCYRGMNRTGGGRESKLGHNSKSWSLDCSPGGLSFQHNGAGVPVGVACSRRVGVYLDHRAGVLTFYSVSDKMTLLHRVKTTFTHPLYPGFWVGLGSTLKICSIHKRVSWS